MRSGDRVLGESGDRLIARDRVIGTTVPRPTALFRTLRAILREIFDESAYDRFLLRTQEVRSAESYREFMREREAGMAKRPRCC